MVKISFVLGAIFAMFIIIPIANAQDFEKATFQETATIIYDQKLSNSVITSIGFETTSNEEVRFSDELIKKINSNEEIRAIVFTNAGECVIGITSEEQCIMINFDYQRLKGDGGIRTVQDSAKEMSEDIINELQDVFDTNAKFHSTFIHTVDDSNVLLETSGVVSGRGAVSATYVMPKQSTDYLFSGLGGKLIPKDIRDGGGFYDVAEKIATDESSIISISILKNGDSNLFMFKVANSMSNTNKDSSKINVLEHLGIKEISRSDVFDGRNVPLNSVIQLIVIPSEPMKIDAISTHAITDVTTIEGISEKGWFFSSPAGNKIDAKFLFGKDKIISSDELRVEINSWDGESEMTFYSVENIPQKEYESVEEFVEKESNGEESQYVILGIVIAVGIGAAIFYLKGYKSKS
tara:strand:- start:1217 stop:2437 length:1221 start_codon:yes stop_codon:yes gene_type:complete